MFDGYDPAIHIPFTRYHRPFGHQERIWIERPADVVVRAQACCAHGGRFACECLRSGAVSLTFECDSDDLDGEIVPNGPRVPGAVDALVERVHRHFVKEVA